MDGRLKRVLLERLDEATKGLEQSRQNDPQLVADAVQTVLDVVRAILTELGPSAHADVVAQMGSPWAMTHEADTLDGPWTPIEGGRITKRYTRNQTEDIVGSGLGEKAQTTCALGGCGKKTVVDDKTYTCLKDAGHVGECFLELQTSEQGDGSGH